jgi:hypothetical protein
MNYSKYHSGALFAPGPLTGSARRAIYFFSSRVRVSRLEVFLVHSP